MEILILTGILFIALVLFVTDWMPIDFVSIGLMLALMLTGLVSLEEGLAGFSNPATVTVAFMFIVSGALLRTGALQNLSYRILPYFNDNPRKGLLLMMILVALASAFINNTPTVAVFIPVVLQVAGSSGISPSKLLIPLSFASIMGGMCTVFGTSTNLLVSGIAADMGVEGVGVFSMTLPAFLLLIPGLFYMVTLGVRLIPDRQIDIKLSDSAKNYLVEIQIDKNSDLQGKKIMNSKIIRDLKLDVLEIRRNDVSFNLPPGDFELQSGDVLRIRCNARDIASLSAHVKVLPKSEIKIAQQGLKDKNVKLVEFVITPESDLIGKTLKHADFRRAYRAAPLAIRHRDRIKEEDLYETELQSGDIILAQIKSHYLSSLQSLEKDQNSPIAVISEIPLTDFDRKKFITVLLVLFGMISLAAFGILNIAVSVVAAVLILVLLNSLKMKEAYEYVNWKIVFVMAGVLSIGKAMQNTGFDGLITNFFATEMGGYSAYIILGTVYILTSLLTEIISNTATAAIMTPIAIGTAAAFGFNPMPFVIGVMFASSASFMTPIGYQTNTMIYEAGNYRFGDFFRVGILLNLIFWLGSTLLIPFFFPF